jgi:6-phosphogluconolactonase (cycloisomerase 2 family)
MTNNRQANEIVVFERDGQGRLQQGNRVATGGRGSGGGIDPLSSQDSLLLDQDGRWLYAVNAGSTQISRFSIDGNSLELVALVSSRGATPISLTQRGKLLYVLNAGSRPNIHGFRLKDDGSVVKLNRSKRFLASDIAPSGLAESPVQVSFTPDGAWLVLTDRETDEIQIFSVDEKGRPSDNATRWPSVGGGPFGFDFDPRGYLLVSELFGRNPPGVGRAGAVSSYRISEDGALEVLSPSVDNFQAATCWLVSDGRRNAFTTNTASGTLSRYKVRRNGRVRRRGTGGVEYRFPANPGALPIDLAVTPNGKFLYTLNTGRGTVGMFRVRRSGRLVSLGEAGALPIRAGLQGIAAR